MRAYSNDYLNDVVENQGKLFDFVAQNFSDKDTEDFIIETEHYILKSGKALDGFMPDWIGEFYAYYQWYYNIPSSEVLKKVPIDFLKKAYYGLHDLELDLAVQKVGEER